MARICIWGPDTSSTASSSSSPHPLKLIETIATGHRANIFSAKYLPNTSTPTIVTCAGDKQVRVFDVERLSRHETGVAGGSTDLYGVTGPG
jgi:nuclear receptor interaction protein